MFEGTSRDILPYPKYSRAFCPLPNFPCNTFGGRGREDLRGLFLSEIPWVRVGFLRSTEPQDSLQKKKDL